MRRLGWVAAASVICVFVSERVYWYFNPGPAEQIELVLFYGLATASVLWLLGRYRVSDGLGVVLVIPVFAYLVEGAIVPVLYSGGPLVPIFPALFVFWHGMLGVWLVLLQFRRWLLDGRWRPLLVSAVALGLYWGMWAQTAIVEAAEPEWADEFGNPPEIFSTAGFAVYAAACTVALAVAHWLLGFFWMPDFAPGRWARRAWFGVVALTVGGWTVVIPWAAPMFIVYVGLQLWALRRNPAGPGPTVLEALCGRVPVHRLWPLAAIPVAAWLSFWYWSSLALSPEVIEEWIFLFSSVLQVMAGLGVLVVSHWRRHQRSRAALLSDSASAVEPVSTV